MITFRKVGLVAAIIALACTSRTAVSQITQDPEGDSTVDTIGGAYRDLEGKLWCGGSCMSGQQCCRITMLADGSVEE